MMLKKKKKSGSKGKYLEISIFKEKYWEKLFDENPLKISQNFFHILFFRTFQASFFLEENKLAFISGGALGSKPPPPRRSRPLITQFLYILPICFSGKF